MNFKEEIHKVPFVRLLFPLILGILFQISYPLNQSVVVISTFSVFLILIISLLLSKWLKKKQKQYYIDFSIAFLIFLFGLFLVSESESKLKILKNQDLSDGFIIAEIIEPVSIKENSLKAILNVIAIKNNEYWEETSGKAVVYFEKDSNSLLLKYGDRLLLDANFSDVEGPKNPEEFNYKQYLAFHLISKHSFIKSGNWKIITKNSGNPLIGKTYKFREKLIGIYTINGIKGRELAVLSALTLGYKDKLDAETKKSYSSSGAMHLLAVSGLHMGIIYLIINLFLSLFPKSKKWKILKLIILLSTLWIYALMTGLPVSAFRASIMFSIIAIGTTLERKPNIYNSLAASAFILLIINPYSITEVGFQLSYLAVAGIVFFQPKISSIFSVKNKMLKWMWDLVSVSLAAQIATAPVAIYYFHQFPNYFLLTNLIVIPAAFLIEYFSILLLAFSFFRPISSLFAWVDIHILKFLNSSVQYIEYLPYSITSNINISVFQLLSLYLTIILIAIFIVSKNSKIIKYIIVCSILFFSIKAYHYHKTLNQNYFIVYNIKKSAVYNFINGRRNTLIADQIPDSKAINFHIKNNWIKLGLMNEDLIQISNLYKAENYEQLLQKLKKANIIYEKGIFFFQNSKIIILTNRFKNLEIKNKYSVDYIILTDNGLIDIDYIISNFNFKRIIFDSSFSSYKLKKLIKKCDKLQLQYYSVADQGAFVVDM